MPEIKELLSRYPVLLPCEADLRGALDLIAASFRAGGKLLVAGNGGSAADAQHIVGELAKGFRLPRPLPREEKDALLVYGESGARLAATLQCGLSAIALGCGVALSTAFANDADPILGFAQELNAIGRAGDVFLAISTSGNSENLLAAATLARVKGIAVIALTGAGGGRLRDLADVTVAVPERETYRVQELHLPVYHALCLALENRFFAPKEGVFVGVDIGGTKCAVVFGDGEGRILRKEKFPTADSESTLRRVEEIIERADAVCAIGISCGGPLDCARGLILSPPNLPGWDEVPVVSRLADRFGVPVRLANDADACALAEWRFGAGRGTQNMIFLTFGTGLGAGLILDGRLYRGASSSAGEVGHIRIAEDGPLGYGKRGSLEGFCSGGGIARLAKEMMEDARTAGEGSLLFDGEEPTAATVAAAAQAGDSLALRIYEKSAETLGSGLALLVDILNPECIVIGSVYARNEELFREKMTEVLVREALPANLAACRILPAALGESIGDVAALSVAML
jgi:glucokinase